MGAEHGSLEINSQPAALRDSPPLFQTGFEISKCPSMTCTAVKRPPTFTSFCSNAMHLGEGLAPRGVIWATRLGARIRLPQVPLLDRTQKIEPARRFFRKANLPQTMRTLKNTDDLVDRTKSACLLQAHQKPNLYAVFSLCCSP
jgi:hypothetical protein